jgi:hypothetical protein
VTDWTIILTAVGTAFATGGLGYLGIRRSTDVTRYQVSEETARAHALSEAENERLRAQHREDHLRNRQGTYHNLLTAEQNLAYALGPRGSVTRMRPSMRSDTWATGRCSSAAPA